MPLPKPAVSLAAFFSLTALFAAFAPRADAATYYVSKSSTARDTYTAAESVDNPAKPYLTIERALQRARDGFATHGVDEIIVEPGVYPEEVRVRQSGLTLRARNDATLSSARSIIRPAGPDVWSIVNIANCQNVTVRGFEVDGTAAYVYDDQTEILANSTQGIQINGKFRGPTDRIVYEAASRVTISHCIIRDVKGGGITTSIDGEFRPANDPALNALNPGVDYLTIADNIIYNNCFLGKEQASAINLYMLGNQNPADTGPHNFVLRNHVYNNIAKFTGLSLQGDAKHTDANGIIFDYGRNTGALTLVENNLIYKNGGRGIHVFNSSNVIARNNTTYKNSQDPDINEGGGGGELTAISGRNIHYLNNVSVGYGGATPIFVARAGFAFAQAGGTIQNITFRANTYTNAANFTSTSPAVTLSANFNENPFLHDPEAADFTVNRAPGATQYVIDRGSGAAGDFAAADFLGTPRPQGAGIDRGAYETTPPAALAGAIISEFRWRGPNGGLDEFVEIFNTTGAALDVGGWSLRYLNASGLETVILPPLTTIPARGHLLFTGADYSLSAFGQSDRSLLADAINSSGAALYNAEKTPVLQDAVGFAASPVALREGAGLPNHPTTNAQFAFVRDYLGAQPKNTADSTDDFLLVATSDATLLGSPASLTPQLGAPSPQGTLSPVAINDLIGIFLLDTEVPATPNRVRNGGLNSGTLLLRRTLVNRSNRTLSKIRFHITRITSKNSPILPGLTDLTQADVRFASSSDEPKIMTSKGEIAVYATRPESPSIPGQGALGSAMSWDVTLSTPLQPQETRSYSFSLGVAKSGTYIIAGNVEALTTPPF